MSVKFQNPAMPNRLYPGGVTTFRWGRSILHDAPDAPGASHQVFSCCLIPVGERVIVAPDAPAAAASTMMRPMLRLLICCVTRDSLRIHTLSGEQLLVAAGTGCATVDSGVRERLVRIVSE